MSSQVVLITGGLTGIGRAAAVAFAKKGAKVVVAGRRDEAGKALAKELRSFGSEAEFINADVRKEDDVRALVDKTVARFGRLDVAVNNAGTEGQVGPITDQTAESYAATFDTNVLGVILSMKHEVRVMQGQGSGSIINISSTYGHEGAAGASVYVGSKHAVEGITKSVALEVAKSGIRVNAVAPGPTDTGMLTRFTGTPENKAALVTTVPMARLGLSEELANAIVFIASDEASFITGHVLNVDGGKTSLIRSRARRLAPRPVKGRSSPYGFRCIPTPPAFDRFACRHERHRQGGISMIQHSHPTAPPQFVDAAGVRFACRRFGWYGSPLDLGENDPRGREGMATLTLEAQAVFGVTYANPDELWLGVFFTPTEASHSCWPGVSEAVSPARRGSRPGSGRKGRAGADQRDR